MSLSNNDYQDIMRQYEERRLSNYRLYEQRKKDIYTTIPEIKELDRQITANSISLGKQLIVRDDPALREEYRIKNAKRRSESIVFSQRRACNPAAEQKEPSYFCRISQRLSGTDLPL